MLTKDEMIKRGYQKRWLQSRKNTRNEKMVMMYLDGYTFQEVADRFGISKQRVNKIWLDYYERKYRHLLKDRVKRKDIDKKQYL